MRSEIVVRLSIDNAYLPDGVRPDQHFDEIIKQLREREPETDVQVEMGVLDTLKDLIEHKP